MPKQLERQPGDISLQTTDSHGSSPGQRPASRVRALTWVAGIGVLAALIVGGVQVTTKREAPAPPPAADLDAEESRLLQAVASRPNDASARVELGRYFEAREGSFEAMWEYAEARALAPEDAHVPRREAAVLRAGQVVDLGTRRLEEALRAQPDDLDTRAALANAYLATARAADARALMEARSDDVWKDAESVLALGQARHAAGDDAGARAAFDRSIALENRGHRAWYALGRLHLREGRSEQARDALLHAMVAERSRPEYPFTVGLTHLQEGGPENVRRALGYFKEAVALDGNFARAHYHAGAALERQGNRRQALTHYSLALLGDSDYPEPNLALGRGLTGAGEARQAHRFFGRWADITDRPERAAREFAAMAEGAEGVLPALLVSQVYIRTQQTAKATPAIEAALARYPKDTRLLERLASLKIQLGDRVAARRLLNRWLELAPTAATPHWLLGRCDLGDMKYAEGIARLERAVALDPKSAHPHGFMGAALMRLGTPEGNARAVEALRQAVTLAPNDAQYHDFYGQALGRVGRHEEARREFLKALNVDPSRVACLTPLSQLAWRLQRTGPSTLFAAVTRSVQRRVTEESLLWPHVWQNPTDDEGRLKLARFFCETGHLDRARHQLDQILERRPTHAAARALLATVLRCQEALA